MGIEALGAPWRSGPWTGGLRHALVPSIVAEALVWGTAPFVGYHLLLAVAFVGGVLGLPVFTVARQSLSVLVTEEQRRTAFSLDSIGVEVSLMVGPAAGVVVATQVLGLDSRPARSRRAHGRGRARALRGRPADPLHGGGAGGAGGVGGGTVAGGVRTCSAPALPPCSVHRPPPPGALGHGRLGVVAVLRDHGAVTLTGVVFAAWSIGSPRRDRLRRAARRPVFAAAAGRGSPF